MCFFVDFTTNFAHDFTKSLGETEVKKLTLEIVEAWQKNQAAKLRGQAGTAEIDSECISKRQLDIRRQACTYTHTQIYIYIYVYMYTLYIYVYIYTHVRCINIDII